MELKQQQINKIGTETVYTVKQQHSGDKMKVKVIIHGIRTSFNKVQYHVTPVNGSGSIWINAGGE